MSTQHFDLVIVGGGMVGASLAIALAGRGLRMALIEAYQPDAESQPSYDDRAIALAYGTRRIFEALDVWPRLAEATTPIRDIHVSDRGHFGFTRLAAGEEGVPALGYVVTARNLGRVLLERLPQIDGLDITPLLRGDKDARSPHEAFWFYYHQNELHALRSGRWKLLLPHAYRTLGDQPKATGGIPAKYRQARAGLELYDLETDPEEHHDLAASKPEVVARLQDLVEKARADLGDALTKRPPTNARPPGRLDEP